MPSQAINYLAAITFAFLSSACSPSDSRVVSYHQTIQPMVARRCLSCHAPGGIGPFEIDTYERLKATAALSLAAIESGSMPPWQPSNDCNEYRGEQVLSDQEKSDFRTWVTKGMPKGLPQNNVAPTSAHRGLHAHR
jgi:hypothetical protein